MDFTHKAAHTHSLKGWENISVSMALQAFMCLCAALACACVRACVFMHVISGVRVSCICQPVQRSLGLMG